jgi:hypothetical protein
MLGQFLGEATPTPVRMQAQPASDLLQFRGTNLSSTNAHNFDHDSTMTEIKFGRQPFLWR